jgi:hypothetical protein
MLKLNSIFLASAKQRQRRKSLSGKKEIIIIIECKDLKV